MIFDAHFHLPVCIERGLEIPSKLPPSHTYASLTCAHSPEEWLSQYAFASSQKGHGQGKFFLSYGLHPQEASRLAASQVKGSSAIQGAADFLEGLLKEGKLSAIGEAGFDYFTRDFREQASVQEEIWQIQLEFAINYKLPLVIHCRKANHKLFEYSRELKACPAVLFHSFMGPLAEAKSLLDRGINGFFSFGKQMNNGNKKTLECVKSLPLENLLLETDAPFQTLKGEENTQPKEILDIYNSAAAIRNISMQELSLQLEINAGKLLGNDINN